MGLIRNLSLRVPWHDRAWDGHVCDDPLANSACLALKLIAEKRKDHVEAQIAAEAFDKLQAEEVPPCMRASAAFLSPHPHSFQSVMAYSAWSKDHAHILPGAVHLPAWGAMTIPYRWMLKEHGFAIAEELELEATPEREPDAPDWLGRTSWIQGFSNQEALLNAFAAPLVEEESLVLFYATRTPLCDDERRVILGGALLKKTHQLCEYPYKETAPLRAMIWERTIQHSLRRAPEGGGYVDGFVMPYHAVLAESGKRGDLDPREFIAFAPDDCRAQFSYGSEHVTHGAAAASLVAVRNALERTAVLLNGPWDRYLRWIDERLARLWKLQGPAPGLGVVLSALHPGFNGTLFAMALASELPENADPWPSVDAIFRGERPAPPASPAITSMLGKRWQKRVKAQPEQLDFLKLLARFELTADQAQRAMGCDAKAALANPYLLFEGDRINAEAISFGIIDRGLYPGKEVSAAHPLPKSCSPSLTEYDNEKRLRAACVQILEQVTERGHSFLPVSDLKNEAEQLSSIHKIPLDADTVDICRDDFAPLITVSGDGDGLTVQLDRYVIIGGLLGHAVKQRLEHETNSPEVNWHSLVDEKFGAMKHGDADEARARAEKAAALANLAASRIGVLIGPAGTGKTTVLQMLLARTDIVGARIKLLAPTGKARVRLGQETGQQGQVQTVAQFLLGTRFDPDTGRYYTNSEASKSDASTCIVDESSMLTEDMLAAIVDAIGADCRLILVGDPYQLPPIGAGCPFVDIIEHLKRQEGNKGVAELHTPRRQATAEKDAGLQPVLSRSDVQLAAIFSGRELPPGEDEVVARAIDGTGDETVKYRQWESPSELSALIEAVLCEEFRCDKDGLVEALETSLGAEKNEKGYLNFGRGSAASIEDLQILSVNRTGPGGSLFLNRRIKETLRAKRLSDAISSNNTPFYKKWMRYVKPRGPEQIVYGDKVICVRNHSRKPWHYQSKKEGDREFIANGEIGVVTGQMSYGNSNPSFTHVEFTGREDRSFSFRRSDFSEDGQPYLELAYAITVHKAQGSEFGVVLLVLPAQSRLVSREMLYTALTRQKKRIWILHQGPFERYVSLRQYMHSDIAARYTNLLRLPILHAPAKLHDAPLAANQRGFLQERLIHRTLRGEMVSSKNELVIANLLYGLEKEGGLAYRVEPPLPFADGRGRWADFQIEAKGQSWYWEHCGMMDDENYRRRWEAKLRLYAANGFTPYAPDNAAGRLIVTHDGPERGLDSKELDELARKVFR